MLAGRVAEGLAVSAVAAILTLVIAAPVLRAPSERVFGMEIVGRHHDPFTAMEQFGRPIAIGVYAQPVTDVAGALLARLSGVVAAYNVLVLLSFPLSAFTAYLLARHLSLSASGATIAALAYAFSPFHLAQAAYHPHIAQTQWLPLYFLALFRCLDLASPTAVAALGAATVAVTLSNFYGGLIAAALTPVAAAAYWWTTRHDHPHPLQRLAITSAGLVMIAALGAAYVFVAADAVMANRAAVASRYEDLWLYSARWWSYAVPPVAHPVLGPWARRIWEAAGVRTGLLEQQVSLGWAVVALALVAAYARLFERRLPASRNLVPVLAAIGIVAYVCSLSSPFSGTRMVWPSDLLYQAVPMFRSYARFGVVVQLMAALLAGLGVEYLWQAGTGRTRFACIALVALAAAEYGVAPWSLWRDTLPTSAHRWVAQQSPGMRVLDCSTFGPDSASVQWLTANRIGFLGGQIGDCTEPNLSEKLAANGYTHLLVPASGNNWRARAGSPDASGGFRAAAQFADADVYVVTATTPPIYTATMTGFYRREHDADWSWRWMGGNAAWTIVNTRAKAIVATLGVEMAAFNHQRGLTLLLDGRPIQALMIHPERGITQIGPLIVTPGNHELEFDSSEEPTVAGNLIGNKDPRRLSVAMGNWHWVMRGEEP